MATSDSTNFNLVCSQIIDEVGENLGFVIPGQTATAEEYSSCKRTLNNLVKAVGEKGIRYWAVEWVVEKFTSAASVVSNNSVNYKCQLPHVSTATDEPGVGVNSSLYWVITEDTAGGAWALSQTYTTPAAFSLNSDTLDIIQAFYRDNTGSDHRMEIISFSEYLDINDKDKTGTMKFLALQKKLGVDRAYVYQPTNLLTDVLHYLRVRKLEDFDRNSNDADFPQAAYRYLALALTYDLRLKFPTMSANEVKLLRLDRDEAFSDMKQADQDDDEEDFIKGAY